MTFPSIGSQQGSSPGPLGGSSGNGGAGGGGNVGTAQSGGANSATPKQSDPQIVIPTELLIIATIVALIIAGAGFMVSQRKNLSWKRRGATTQASEVVLNKTLEPSDKTSFFDPASELVGEERVSDLVGWNGDGFVKPRIREDLPLIWSLDEPLPVSAPVGTRLSLSITDLAESSRDSSSLKFVLILTAVCNKVAGISGQATDEKWIRAVRYNEDVTKLFRLNLLNSSGIDLKSMTARELSSYVAEKHPELVNDGGDLFALTRIFERAFYGRKEISRKQYEIFLEKLRSALRSPKVIVCGPRESISS